MIYRLNNHQCVFPNPELALSEPNGLLAVGGNLAPSTLLNAYQLGIFPWYNAPEPILWWSPNPRMVLRPQDVHISKSMKKILRKHTYSITCDHAFTQVMRACAGERNYTNETWISNEIIDAYSQLHTLGYAHSIEAWQKNTLVGGLYGIALGRIFFGESMFSLADNASKIAFITLCNTLAQCGFELIDCQVYSEHLASLGAEEIPRSKFQQHLKTSTIKEPNDSPWAMLNHHE